MRFPVIYWIECWSADCVLTFHPDTDAPFLARGEHNASCCFLSAAIEGRAPWSDDQVRHKFVDSGRRSPVKECWVSKDGCYVSLLLVLRQRLLHGLFCHWLCPCFLPRNCNVARKHGVIKDSNLALILFIVSWLGRSQTPHGHVQSLWYVFQARRTLNSRRGLSQSDQLQVVHLVKHATWFSTEDHITLFLHIVTNGFCAWSNFQLLQLFVDFFHLFFVFQDGILRYSFHSKIDFEFWLFVNTWNRIPLQFPETGRTWILCRIAFDISILSSDLIQFPGARRRTTESGCCCCCECQLLLSVTFGAGRGVESLSNCLRSPFWEITQKMQSAGTGLCTVIALDCVCQNRNPWSCARDNVTQSATT